MVRRWLDRGVDGFRLDVFNAFLKHPGLPSNPSRPGTSTWARQVHRYDRDQPDLKELIGRFRAMVDAVPGSDDRRRAVRRPDRAGGRAHRSAPPGLRLGAARARSGPPRRSTRRWPAAKPSSARIAGRLWSSSNHDQSRHASRLVASVAGHERDAVAKAAAVLLLTVRGTPFIYYGEEIGVEDVEIPSEESVDPPAARVGPDFAWWDRSRCRTPMPWTGGPGAGFTTGRPWLRIGVRYGDPQRGGRARTTTSSVLALYRRLTALRAATPALQVGAFELLPSAGSSIVAYTRTTPEQTLLVVLNLAREPTAWRVPGRAGRHRLAHGADERSRHCPDRSACSSARRPMLGVDEARILASRRRRLTRRPCYDVDHVKLTRPWEPPRAARIPEAPGPGRRAARRRHPPRPPPG